MCSIRCVLKRAIFECKNSKYRNFWLEILNFGAFKAVNDSDRAYATNTLPSQKVLIKTYPTLISKFLYDSCDISGFFRKCQFFGQKTLFSMIFKLSYRNEFLIFFNNFLCKRKLRCCTLHSYNTHGAFDHSPGFTEL